MVEQKRWLTDKYWLSHFNYADEVRQQYTLPEGIYIYDVTLREAEQTPHVSLLPQEKVRIAKALDELGVYSVEVAPFYSSYDKEATKEQVREIVERVKGEAAIRKWSVPDFAFKEIVKEALGK